MVLFSHTAGKIASAYLRGAAEIWYNPRTIDKGGDPVSTGRVEVGLRVVDPRWPRKKRGKKVIANNDYALAA